MIYLDVDLVSYIDIKARGKNYTCEVHQDSFSHISQEPRKACRHTHGENIRKFATNSQYIVHCRGVSLTCIYYKVLDYTLVSIRKVTKEN